MSSADQQPKPPPAPKPAKDKAAGSSAVDKKADKAARRAAKVAGRPGDDAGPAGTSQGTSAPSAGPPGQGKPQKDAKHPRAGSSSSSAPPTSSFSSGAQPVPASSSNTSINSKASVLNPNVRPVLIQSSAAPNPPPAPTGPTPNLIVSHLPGPKPSNSVAATLKGDVHPAIIKLGLQLREGKIRGANARLISGLTALKQVIASYTTPPSTTLPRDLTTHLSPQIAHLTQARPMPVGLGNAIRWLKYEISTVSIDEAEADSKAILMAKIDEYIRERVTLADEVIVGFAKEKIRNGDVVLTYARSSVVEKVLIDAFEEMQDAGESFSIIVVDSRPLLEGKNLLLTLSSHSIPCTYALLPALPSVLPRANLVLLGTSALLSNGALYSRAGTAAVAMFASTCAVPVVVCCETYKFGERIQLDAVVSNELALQQINLLYDLTPARYVTAVCTEYGLLPTSSVPTVLSRAGPQGANQQ